MDVLPPSVMADSAELDRVLLDARGRVRVRPAAELQAIDRKVLLGWLHLRAVYLLPTVELVDWLRAELRGLPAIEIGAGNGALGRALGIPRTDSWIQQRGDYRLVYRLMMQPVVNYGDDVERLEAGRAVQRYRPHTVVAAWVTWRHEEGMRDGFADGVDERALLRRVRRFICIGNERTHAGRSLLKLPHRTVEPAWIVSRGQPELDRIWIWERR